MTKVNNPKDKMLKGRVNITIRGLKKAFTRPSARLAKTAVSHLSTRIPGTMCTTAINAIILANHFTRKPVNIKSF
jgi:hypothetical protein